MVAILPRIPAYKLLSVWVVIAMALLIAKPWGVFSWEEWITVAAPLLLISPAVRLVYVLILGEAAATLAWFALGDRSGGWQELAFLWSIVAVGTVIGIAATRGGREGPSYLGVAKTSTKEDPFFAALNRELSRARRDGDSFAVLSVDLATGHSASSLDRVCQLLDAELRAYADIAKIGERVLALVPDVEDSQHALLVKRLTARAESTDNGGIRIGLARFPTDAVCAATLIDSADSKRLECDSAPIIRVAYMMSRFPKLTETFVLDEILEMERSGIAVEIFSLWREDAEVVHPEARALVARARFAPMLNGRIALDNLYYLVRRPRRYLSTLFTLITTNRSNLRFLLGAMAVFPKACSFSLEMNRLGVQHLHAHFASHPAAAAFVVGRMADIPWSFTAHGSDLHREQAMLLEKVTEAAFVVTISEYNKRFILERLGAYCADKVEVIHCGVELARFERAQSQHGPLQIICIGTMHEVKGQCYLLEACALLRDRGVDFSCHLIGDGPDRKALQDQATVLGIGEQVVFHGACEREQVAALLARMHIAVAPSVPTADGRREGIPVALMEAAACGLPLVASRLSGIPELVRDGETGYLIEPGDSVGLADAIYRVADAPALGRQLGDAARQRLELDFNLPINVATLQRLMFPKVTV